MKKLAFLVVALASVSVFATEYRTEKVCGTNEVGDMNHCVLVTYAVRPPSPATAPEPCKGSGEAPNPCPAKSYGVPSWVAKLFGKNVVIDHAHNGDDYKGGP